MSKTQPARGMRDFLPADIRKREYVIGIIKEVYESYGFEPLETPAVENLETLTGKYGEEGNQLIYKILKRGEKLEQSTSERDSSDLALRYDLTVPLARVVAQHKNDLPKFFKRYQIQPVWRADRPARGRYREFYQCDVDAIGSNSMLVEAELISAVSEILTRLGFDDFTIRANHRKLLNALLEKLGISSELNTSVLITLDKLDKIGLDGVLQEFELKGLSDEQAALLLTVFEESKRKNEPWQNKWFWNLTELEFISAFFSPLQIDFYTKKYSVIQSLATDGIINELQNLKNAKVNNLILSQFLLLTKGSELAGIAISELFSIIKYCVNLGIGNRVKLDLTLARGLSYYTGAIFEINVPDFAGSLAGGGRYDGLVGMFGKEQIPACGFSIGLERILVVMEERGMFPKELNDNSADVLVTVWNDDSIVESLKLAGELRKENLRVLVYPEADKLGKQFKYAAQINAPFVCVLGESELAENKVTLKNMQTGEQETIERKEAAARVKTHMQNP
jgi:histidyl-tRNA synthetase